MIEGIRDLNQTEDNKLQKSCNKVKIVHTDNYRVIKIYNRILFCGIKEIRGVI